MKIWHLLRNITLMTIGIERKDWIFNHKLWHDSKVKHIIWNDIILYPKVTWERVVKNVKISAFSTIVLAQSFDGIWSLGTVLCRHDNLKSLGTGDGNTCKGFFSVVTWWVGVILGLVVWFCPWRFLYCVVMLLLRGGVVHPKGFTSPWCGHLFFGF